MSAKFAIILILWDNLDDTLDCIQSIYAGGYKDFEIIVSDNGYNPEYPRILKKVFPQIQVIENKQNLGFAEGNNVGIRLALNHGYQYIFILNNDTVIDNSTLKKLQQVFESNPKIGIAGTMTWEYTNPVEYQICGGMFDPSTGNIDHLQNIMAPLKSGDITLDVDFVFGSGMCIRREIAEQTGLFDKDYYLYFEDIEWCYRAKTKGWRVVVALQSFIWHKMGALQGQGTIRPLSGYYYVRNYNYFIKQYGTLSARWGKHFHNLQVFITKQILLMAKRFGKEKYKIPTDYAVRQGIIDFYRNHLGPQDTWKYKGPGIESNPMTQPVSQEVQEKKISIQFLIVLPDLTEPQLMEARDWITQLAKRYPCYQFLLWFYPTSIIDWNEVYDHHPHKYNFSGDWLAPEQWESGHTIRWAPRKATLDITDIPIEKISMELRPKFSRLHMLIHKIVPFYIPTYLVTEITINKNITKTLQFKGIDFQREEFNFPETSPIHIEFKTNKSYRHSLWNHKQISVAVREIKCTSGTNTGNPVQFFIPLDTDILPKNRLLDDLGLLSNIQFIPPDSIRKTDTLLKTLTGVIHWLPEKSSLKNSILISCQRNQIPLFIVTNKPVLKLEEYPIVSKDTLGDFLEKWIKSGDTKIGYMAQMNKSLESYFK